MCHSRVDKNAHAVFQQSLDGNFVGANANAVVDVARNGDTHIDAAFARGAEFVDDRAVPDVRVFNKNALLGILDGAQLSAVDVGVQRCGSD